MRLSNRDRRLLEEVVLSNPIEDVIDTIESISGKNIPNVVNDKIYDDTSNATSILNFICLLEGYQTRFREYHWSSETMASHKLCDDILGALFNYEDQIAEEFQGIINYRIKPGTIKPLINNIPKTSTNETLNELLINTIDFKKEVETFQKYVYDGILNIIDDMIHAINKFKYLGTFK